MPDFVKKKEKQEIFAQTTSFCWGILKRRKERCITVTVTSA